MGTIFLNELGIICAMGADKDQVAATLFSSSLPETLTLSELFSRGRPSYFRSITRALPAL